MATPTPGSETEFALKTIKRIPTKTIGFVILCILALGITVVSSIMASTNFSFGSDPNYTKNITLDLTPTLEGEEPTKEKEMINPTADAYGIVEYFITESLPYNILQGETVIKEIKIDGNPITPPLLLTEEKVYVVTYKASIVYDASNIIIRASLNAAALILVVFGVILYTIDKRKKSDDDYLREKTAIDKAHTLYRPLLWKSYEDPVNLGRKINAWKLQCFQKETKLDNKAKEEDLRIYLKGTPLEKEKNKYCINKAMLREMASDKWIEDNLSYKTIKFNRISYRLIFIGDNPANGIGQSDDFVTEHKTWIMVSENLPRILIGSGITIMLSLLVIDILSFNITILLNALIALANILWNIYLSVGYGNAFFESRSMWDISFRAGIGNEYVSYITDKKAKLAAALEEPKAPKPITVVQPEVKST